uniref:Cytochrome P450 n=1 Tax=Timema douglasi TaxID=61478 RepID=A0A7R8ZB22_TIMDO|nr:unnamed protein product [Timema douglasi]
MEVGGIESKSTASLGLHTSAETLRKYPPIPLLNRECSKDYKIPGTEVVLQKGMRFGLTQTKVALVMLLSKYNFWKSPKTDIPLKMNPKTFVYANLGGIFLRVTHREKSK